MSIDPTTLTLIVVAGLPILTLAAVALRIRTKERDRRRYLELFQATVREAGAVPVKETVFRRGDRFYSIDPSISPVFSGRLSLRLSAWTDTLYEFTQEDLRDPAPELADWITKVKPSLERVCPDSWRSFSKQHLEVVLFNNTFPPLAYDADRLRTDMEVLDAMAATPLHRSVRGGTVTWREGVEKDLPPWHWKPEQLLRFPKSAHRMVFSYHVDDPYLNEALAGLLFRLAGNLTKQFITYEPDLDFLRYAFGGDAFRRDGILFTADRPRIPVAADKTTDGSFFRGFFAGLDAPPGEPPKYALADAVLDRLEACDFFVRRLFDDENSWFSGEYELITCRRDPAEIYDAVEAMAQEGGARLIRMNRRFHHRLLKDDRISEVT